MRPGLVALAALAAIGPAEAAAEERLTPKGPSTIRQQYLGAHTMEGRPHEIITRWKVRVGPGGKAGRVRLRVLHPGRRATVKGSGPWEWLPAEPGTYEFPAPHVTYDYRDSGLALDQEVGEHALITFYPDDPAKETMADRGEINHLDVFRPPLAEDARDVEHTERRKGEGLRIEEILETDLDHDALGDSTEDVGDLTAVSARVREWRDGSAIIVTRMRNSGTTVRHLPHVRQPHGGRKWGCPGMPPHRLSVIDWCIGQPIGPGEEAEIAMSVEVTADGRASVPTHVAVGAEGPDTNPADNVVALTPTLSVADAGPLAARRPGVMVDVTTDQPTTVLVAARIASVRIARTVVFGAAGTQTIRLTPKRRADRRRINRALRRRGRLTAIVTADAGRGVYAGQRIVLRR